MSGQAALVPGEGDRGTTGVLSHGASRSRSSTLQLSDISTRAHYSKSNIIKNQPDAAYHPLLGLNILYGPVSTPSPQAALVINMS